MTKKKVGKNNRIAGVDMNFNGIKGSDMAYLRASHEHGHLVPKKRGKR